MSKLPLPTIRELLNLLNATADKRLSQNFILDLNVTDKIVSKCIRSKQDVVEIGCGPGGLTRSLLQSPNVSSVLGIEKDERFRPMLEQLQKHYDGRLELMFGDAMKLKLTKSPVHIIGNLPFNIATPLTFKFLHQSCSKKGMFAQEGSMMSFMYQKEVAVRITAKENEPERSRIGVMVQSMANVHQIYQVPSTVFVPRPKVDAAVVQFIPQQFDLDFHSYRQLLTICFGQPRKKLRAIQKKIMVKHLKNQSIQKQLDEAIDFDLRCSQISTHDWLQFGRLCQSLKNE